MKYLLNIQQGKIHNAEEPCAPAKRTAEANKKEFDVLAEAVNFYKGGRRKGSLCTRCFPTEPEV